jgi:hypothetical protein
MNGSSFTTAFVHPAVPGEVSLPLLEPIEEGLIPGPVAFEPVFPPACPYKDALGGELLDPTLGNLQFSGHFGQINEMPPFISVSGPRHVRKSPYLSRHESPNEIMKGPKKF